MGNIRILSVFILLLFSLLLFELPRALIDLLVLANIIFSVVILIKSLLSSKISEIFSFPSMIVLASLFRLCLIVAISKLLLSYGDQGTEVVGRIVESFGVYASGADPIVGIVIFLIIGLVNLLVISKGALRVAEVSARFTLDAIPGKQMAIDSDLRANLISADEASKKRKELNQESQFYASIDGAMKWVQGDALVTFVVAFVCFLLGIALGYQRGLSFQESINTFGVLSIGAGLVNIIPSLLISVASGLLVSKVQSEEFTDALDQVVSQIFSDKKVLLLVAILTTVLFLFSLLGVLNMPFLPFLVFSAISLFLYFAQVKKNFISNSKFSSLFNSPKSALVKIEDNKSQSHLLIGYEAVIVEVGSDVAQYLDRKDSKKNVDNYSALNNYLDISKLGSLKKTGFELPDIKILSSSNIEPLEFRVFSQGNEIKRGVVDVELSHLNCSNSVATSLGYEVLRTERNEINNNQVSCVELIDKEFDSLNKVNISIYKPYEVLGNKVISAVLSESKKTFNISESKKVIKKLPKDVTEELFRENKLNLAEYSEIIKALVKEGVSISNLSLISESAIEFMALNEPDDDRKIYLDRMYNFIRKNLSREIVKDCMAYGDKLRVILLSSEIEEEFKNAISFTDDDKLIKSVNLGEGLGVREAFLRVVKPIMERGSTPIVVLCAQEIRSAVQNYLSEMVNGIGVVRAIAYEEVGSKVRAEIVGKLNLT